MGGVTFSIYQYQQNTQNKDVKLNVEESQFNDDEMKVEMVPIEEKQYRQVGSKDLLGTWVREPIKGIKQVMKHPYPSLTSAVNKKDATKYTPKLLEGAMGYMMYVGSTVEVAKQGVNILTSMYNSGHGVQLLPDNFERAMVGFSSRRSATPTWVNAKDNFSKPNQPLPQEFNLDCVIYSLFDNQSYQAAYRNWEYAPGKTYSNTQLPGVWANQFFWVPLAQVLEWSDTPDTSLIYQDARGDSDRFVARYLQGKQLSDEAQALLDEGTELYRLSLQYRFLASHSIPEVHPTAWDSGYTQIKRILDEHHPSKDYNKEFLAKREELRAKIEEGVYRYGMLVK